MSWQRWQIYVEIEREREGNTPPPGQFNSRPNLLVWWIGGVPSRWEQTNIHTHTHTHIYTQTCPFSIYNSAVYINRMKCLPNKKVRDVRARERERERERMKGEGKERERGREREGEEESFSVSSAPLLKCQLLSSWLAQFHSSRGRRRTRSSHDLFLLNTRNYCRCRVIRADCCAIPFLVWILPHSFRRLIISRSNSLI